MKPSALVLHIPKVGGTTFRYIALQNYRASQVFLHYDRTSNFNHLGDLALLSAEAKSKLKLVMGHFGYSAKRQLPDQFIAAAMMRDPVQRLISHYKHTVTYGHKFRDLEQKPTLASYLDRLERTHADNLQARLISGLVGESRRVSGDELLDRAMENLERRFALVGITERFDESVLLFSDLLGWRHNRYFKLNLNDRKVEPDPAERERLAYLTRYDQRVYDRAVAMLDAKVGAVGAGFQQRLADYQSPSALRDWMTHWRFQYVTWRSRSNAYRHNIQRPEAAPSTDAEAGSKQGRRAPEQDGAARKNPGTRRPRKAEKTSG